MIECYFCNSKNLHSEQGASEIRYYCPICGHVYLTDDTVALIDLEKLSAKDKEALRIRLRNEYQERRETTQEGLDSRTTDPDG